MEPQICLPQTCLPNRQVTQMQTANCRLLIANCITHHRPVCHRQVERTCLPNRQVSQMQTADCILLTTDGTDFADADCFLPIAYCHLLYSPQTCLPNRQVSQMRTANCRLLIANFLNTRRPINQTNRYRSNTVLHSQDLHSP